MSNCIAQKRKLPSDLNTAKLIFLQYEQIPIDDRFPDDVIALYEKLNEAFKKSNPKLVQEAKKYPFEYTISERALYESLIDQGYKYVIESDLMESVNNGQFTGVSGVIFYSDVYIRDLQSDEKYVLFEMSQNDLIDHKKWIKKFVKLVSKEFDLPK